MLNVKDIRKWYDNRIVKRTLANVEKAGTVRNDGTIEITRETLKKLNDGNK